MFIVAKYGMWQTEHAETLNRRIFLRFQVSSRLLFNIVKSQIYGATVQNETVVSADLKCY